MNIYLNLNKEQKKEIRRAYKNSDIHKNNKHKILRIRLCSALLLIYAIYLIVENTIQRIGIWQYSLAGVCIMAAVIFFIGTIYLTVKLYNDYIITNRKDLI